MLSCSWGLSRPNEHGLLTLHPLLNFLYSCYSYSLLFHVLYNLIVISEVLIFHGDKMHWIPSEDILSNVLWRDRYYPSHSIAMGEKGKWLYNILTWLPRDVDKVHSRFIKTQHERIVLSLAGGCWLLKIYCYRMTDLCDRPSKIIVKPFKKSLFKCLIWWVPSFPVLGYIVATPIFCSCYL